MTLYDAIVAASDRSSLSGYSLVSLFDDGRFSMQGGLEGAKRSVALPVVPQFHGLFTTMRGEMLFDAATTIQSGLMPTTALTGHARIRFERDDQGGHTEAAVARAFDGRVWQTVLMGEARAWMRRGSWTSGLRSAVMQLGVGDVLADNEAQVEWFSGGASLTSSLGIRLGEAERGTTAWGGLSVTWPGFVDAWATMSVGSSAADLIQNLPAGRYVAFGLRLPHGRLPAIRRPPPLPPPPAPRTPDLPVSYRLALVTGPALDSTNIREVKVWAPGARAVEVMADFVDWIPVPLVRQSNGEWRGYYRIAPGLHRLNVRIDGADMDTPMNWPLDKDEFLGTVALVLVR
jgi:hypothetical protein